MSEKAVTFPLHSCAIFATHNSLLSNHQIRGGLTLDLIRDQIYLTKFFPVCIELDFEVGLTNKYIAEMCELENKKKKK